MSNFDKSNVQIVVSSHPKLELRSASHRDLEYLREWKNNEKNFFFHQEEITSDQQQQWFELFENRPNDLMFMIECERQVFGCMGIRLQDDCWDVYNVILGLKKFGGCGLMGSAFGSMLQLAQSLHPVPVTLQVLKHNPAVRWYQKQGFEVVETYDSHFFMIYQPN